MSKVPGFKRIDITDRQADQLQNNVGDVLDVLTDDPRLNGRILEDEGDGTRAGITLVAGTAKRINHGLDRVLRGWKLIDNTANAVVWRDLASSNPAPTRHLYLLASANTTIKLEVF